MNNTNSTGKWSVISGVTGIASFFLAIVQMNLPLLTEQQRWGLAIAAAAAIWGFFFASHNQIIRRFTAESSGHRIWTVLLGTIVVAGLALFIVPLFRFGLQPDDHQIVPTCVAIAYCVVGAARTFWLLLEKGGVV